MDKFDVAYTIDQNYQVPFCCSLASLLEHNQEHIGTIYLIHDESSSKSINIKKINEFIGQKYGKEIEEIVVDSARYSKFCFTGHVTTVAYYIFSIAEYLPQKCQYVLYLDPDTVVARKLDLLGECVFKPETYLYAIDHGFLPVDRLQTFCPNLTRYFNGGVLFLNLPQWRQSRISSEFWNYANNRPKQLMFWNQDILNIVLYDKWKELPYSYNAYDIKQKLDYTPHIIHYTGNRKPWNYFCDHPYKDNYWKVLKQTPFNQFASIKRLLSNIITPILLPIANLKNKLRKVLFTYASKGEN